MIVFAPQAIRSPPLRILRSELVGLELLQHVVDRELDVAVLEPGDEAERDHVVTHRIDEGAAELAVLRPLAQRPTHRVDDVLERLRNLPDLLDAERPDLRLRAFEPEAGERGTGEVALRPLREDGELRDDVRAWLVRGERLPVTAEALVAGADAVDAAVRDEQLLSIRLRQDRRAARLRLLGEEACKLRDRDDPVGVVAHRRRRRDPERRPPRQQIDGLAVHLPVARDVFHRQPILEEAAERARVDDRAGEQVRARALALLDDRDGDVAEPLRGLGRALEQLAETDRAGEPGRTAADDQDADLDPLVGRIGGSRDRVGRREGRRVVGRSHSHDCRMLTTSGPSAPRSASAGSGAGRRRRRSRRTRRWARSGPC